MPDIGGVLDSLTRIQSDLRFLDRYPDHYPPDGHFDRIVNLTTLLQAETVHWMRPDGQAERRSGQRRHEDRRSAADRRHDERRQGQPSTDASTDRVG